MAEDGGREHKRRLTGCLLAALVGLGFGLLVAGLLLKAWGDCSAGASGFNQLGAAIGGGGDRPDHRFGLRSLLDADSPRFP